MTLYLDPPRPTRRRSIPDTVGASVSGGTLMVMDPFSIGDVPGGWYPTESLPTPRDTRGTCPHVPGSRPGRGVVPRLGTDHRPSSHDTLRPSNWVRSRNSSFTQVPVVDRIQEPVSETEYGELEWSPLEVPPGGPLRTGSRPCVHGYRHGVQ